MSAIHPAPLRLHAIRKNGQVDELPVLPPQAAELATTTAEVYLAIGFVPPWIGYLAVALGHVVGTCAFKGPPRNGLVEISFFTFPQYESQGFATAMAKELVAIVHASRNPPLVGAQTPAVEGAATSVLRKAGFIKSGIFHHPHAGRLWNWTGPKKLPKKP